MRKSLLLLLLTIIGGKLIAQSTLSTDNGLSAENNVFKLGGALNKSTLINGNFNALRFTNLDTFFVGGRYIQFINSTRKTYISSQDSLQLQSYADILISAGRSVTIDGKVRLTSYKNTATLDSVLTVDNCGNLKLVSQSSLQTISQNAFTKSGNAFGTDAYFGTNDKANLYFKTNNVNRGSIDTNGVLNYNNPLNVNKSKLQVVSGDLEINGAQDYVTTTYTKAKMGINFVWAGEPLPRGTISFNPGSSAMNHTSHGGFRFYTGQPGIPAASAIPDLSINNKGMIKFGGKYAYSNVDEPSAAYQFAEYIDPYGIPKGIILPRVSYSYLRNYISKPAEGLIIYNMQTHDLEVFKPDGWHRFVTSLIAPVTTSAKANVTEETSTSAATNSFVETIGDGKQKSFSITHNLNSAFVMVQFIDCGPEANCNLLLTLPEGARIELDGKDKAVITFKDAPAFNRYKVMFLKVQ